MKDVNQMTGLNSYQLTSKMNEENAHGKQIKHEYIYEHDNKKNATFVDAKNLGSVHLREFPLYIYTYGNKCGDGINFLFEWSDIGNFFNITQNATLMCKTNPFWGKGSNRYYLSLPDQKRIINHFISWDNDLLNRKNNRMFIKIKISDEARNAGVNFYMGSVWYNKAVNFGNNGHESYIFDSKIESNPLHINIKEVKNILSLFNLQW